MSCVTGFNSRRVQSESRGNAATFFPCAMISDFRRIVNVCSLVFLQVQ